MQVIGVSVCFGGAVLYGYVAFEYDKFKNASCKPKGIIAVARAHQGGSPATIALFERQLRSFGLNALAGIALVILLVRVRDGRRLMDQASRGCETSHPPTP